MNTSDRDTFRSIADALWAISEEKEPNTNTADYIQLEQRIGHAPEGNLKKLLEMAAIQLRCQHEAKKLEAEIAAKKALLAKVQMQILSQQQLKYLASDIHKELAK